MRAALCLLAAMIWGDGAWAADPAPITITYISQMQAQQPDLAAIEDRPADEGLQGARLAIADNATTGKFLKQRYELEEIIVPEGGDPAAALRAAVAKGRRLIVSTLPAPALKQALPEARDALVLNAGAPDEDLRNAGCAANLLHTLPDRAMLADALGQYLVRRNWKRWLLVVGAHPEDEAYAAAIRRTAKRYGAKIVAEKRWSEEHDAHRTEKSEMPVFTQAPDHDVVMVADEIGEWGDYLMYRTWSPRPVAGTQGLVAAAWDPTVEEWGATQLQNRFKDQAKRPMNPKDFAAWLAVRSIGEAATRRNSTDFTQIREALLAPDFSLAAFKGDKLSFRQWDGQMRQPIPLASARSMVSMSPQEGYLHPTSDLDSLGYDKPESGCKK